MFGGVDHALSGRSPGIRRDMPTQGNNTECEDCVVVGVETRRHRYAEGEIDRAEITVRLCAICRIFVPLLPRSTLPVVVGRPHGINISKGYVGLLSAYLQLRQSARMARPTSKRHKMHYFV